MAKTHLEHQQVRLKQNAYGNASTAAYDAYRKYSPWEGITTALILGELPHNGEQNVYMHTYVHII